MSDESSFRCYSSLSLNVNTEEDGSEWVPCGGRSVPQLASARDPEAAVDRGVINVRGEYSTVKRTRSLSSQDVKSPFLVL